MINQWNMHETPTEIVCKLFRPKIKIHFWPTLCVCLAGKTTFSNHFQMAWHEEFADIFGYLITKAEKKRKKTWIDVLLSHNLHTHRFVCCFHLWLGSLWFQLSLSQLPMIYRDKSACVAAINVFRSIKRFHRLLRFALGRAHVFLCSPLERICLAHNNDRLKLSWQPWNWIQEQFYWCCVLGAITTTTHASSQSHLLVSLYSLYLCNFCLCFWREVRQHILGHCFCLTALCAQNATWKIRFEAFSHSFRLLSRTRYS